MVRVAVRTTSAGRSSYFRLIAKRASASATGTWPLGVDGSCPVFCCAIAGTDATPATAATAAICLSSVRRAAPGAFSGSARVMRSIRPSPNGRRGHPVILGTDSHIANSYLHAEQPGRSMMIDNVRTRGEAVMARSGDRHTRDQALQAAAGNGLIDRRALLGRGMIFAGAIGAGVGPAAAGAEPLADDPWSLETGDPMPLYQVPSKFEAGVARTLSNPNHEARNS